MNCKILDIKSRPTEKLGSLSFFEGSRDLPFEIKRIYYTYGVPKGTCRGGHAHKALSQLLFCPFGKIKIILDDGASKKEVMLDSPDKGLLVEPGLWRDMLWLESNSVLCVAASDYYDETDYVRNYDDFLKIYGGKDER